MIFASRETRTVKTGEKRNDGKKGPTPPPARSKCGRIFFKICCIIQ